MVSYTVTDTSRDNGSAFSTEAGSPLDALHEFAVESGYDSIAAYHAARGTTEADIVIAVDPVLAPKHHGHPQAMTVTLPTPGLTDNRGRRPRKSTSHELAEAPTPTPGEAEEREKAERRAAFARCRAGSATDSDRALLATRSGNMMNGPVELQRCPRHPRNTEAYRWYWEAPKPGEDPVKAVEGSEGAEFVRGCPKCENEQQEKDLYDWDD